jgi:hypothetical protein
MVIVDGGLTLFDQRRERLLLPIVLLGDHLPDALVDWMGWMYYLWIII